MQIQEEVCKILPYPINDLKGKKRVKGIVVPRQIAMFLSRELTDNSLPKIGAEFGGKDHTTVIHAHEKIQHLSETDPTIKNEIQKSKTFSLVELWNKSKNMSKKLCHRLYTGVFFVDVSMIFSSYPQY